RMPASRLVSCEPSSPSDLTTTCLSRRPPASLTSNSAALRLPAPKSTARNDFTFNMLQVASTNPRRARLGWLGPQRGRAGYANRAERSNEKLFFRSANVREESALGSHLF